MKAKFSQVSCERLLKGELTPAELDALGNVPFNDIRYFQWEEVLRKSAVQEIAALVRVPVLVQYDVDYESDDHGGMFPSYRVDLKLASKPDAGGLRLDNESEYLLESVEDAETAEVLLAVFGKDQATVTFNPEGDIEDVAVTDEAREAAERLYEAAVYLASHRVDTSAPIAPAAKGP